QIAQVHLSYHWISDAQTVVWDGERTPLEVDIEEIYAQNMAIRTPANPGAYTLILDLVAEYKGWFGIDQSLEIYVQ
ncbi:MAG: hypothetical protein R3330_07525, partial [Saprospiraceae bacterium]|nr:hypothetical protein [Saprospiraceae bacterium]